MRSFRLVVDRACRGRDDEKCRIVNLTSHRGDGQLPKDGAEGRHGTRSSWPKHDERKSSASVEIFSLGYPGFEDSKQPVQRLVKASLKGGLGAMNPLQAVDGR
jgi:hypothetical protein